MTTITEADVEEAALAWLQTWYGAWRTGGISYRTP